MSSRTGTKEKSREKERKKFFAALDRKIKRKKVLSAQEKLYAKLRATGMPPAEAYSLAFEDDVDEDMGKRELARKAKEIERKPHVLSELQRIKEELKIRMVEEAPDAFERIVELSKLAKSEKVRLEANRDILTRAGFNEPVKLQSLAIFALFTPEQLREMLREKMLKTVEGKVVDGTETEG
ncbi:hypothetical protein DRQ05_03190 [bacterium]|nr:MAG: hypothetical protein DRQ05_03190 [bacterium]